MRAVTYLKNRIEFALKSNGTIKVNQNDVDALNQLIEFTNTNYKNTALEDSLILFYLLQNWKVQNQNDQSIALTYQDYDAKGIFQLPSSLALMERLSKLIEPKQTIYDMIAIELWAHQALNRVPKEQWITKETVKELLERELQIAKLNFGFMKYLDKGEVVFTYEKQENNED